MARWTAVTLPALKAEIDWVIDAQRVDPHDVMRCPQCGGILKDWPGRPVRSNGELVYWDQTHGCRARLRVLADLSDDPPPTEDL